jgi:O-antigen ligase/tetratricopeptide (TPR) repeat protein
MTNNLRLTIITLLFAVPFIGLIVSTNLFFPYITGKNLAFRLIVEVVAVLYVLLALREPKFRPRITPVVISFFAFLSVLFVANLNAEYPFKAFFSNFERMEGFFTLVHLFAYFIVAGAVLNTEKLWRHLFQTSLGASVIVGLMGLNQLEEKARIDSTLGNSTYLGAYTLFHIFIAVFLLARHIERAKVLKQVNVWKALIYIGLILFNLVVFFNTGTRGALIGLGAGIGFISLMFAIFEKNKTLKVLGITALTAIVVVFGSLMAFKDTSFVQESYTLSRFAKLATLDPVALAEFASSEGKARFTIWSIALNGVQERPLLGWGQDNFNYIFNEYYDPAIWNQEQWFDRAHNVFFDWLTAGGILGLLAYLSLFVLGVVSVWRARSSADQNSFVFSDKVILTGLFIAYFIHNLFVFDNIVSYILFFSILAFIYMHEKGGLGHEKIAHPISENNITAGSIVAVIVGSVALYMFVLVPYLTGAALIKALVYQNTGLQRGGDQYFLASLDSYKKVIEYNGVGVAEAREQLVTGATQVVFRSNASDAVKEQFATYAMEQMEEQVKETPNDARYHFFYGGFLFNLAQAIPSLGTEKAFEALHRAQELSPRKQSMLLQLVSMYINSKKYDEALTYAKQAFELQQDNTEARALYAASLIYTGDNDGADELLEPITGTKEALDRNIMRAYAETKQNAKVAAILGQKIELADKMAQEGNKQGAVEQIQEVMSVDPSFKEKGDALIAEIVK